VTSDDLARRFEAERPHLRAVAQRMLGDRAAADDAVQEAWLRLSRAGGDDVEDLRAWLTTVVARICLNQLRSRKTRAEDELDADAVDPAAGPEDEAVLADSLGSALLVVLEALSPAERVAFVLHDMFGLAFDEIGPIVERSPEAARQLASRARRRLQGTSPEGAADPGRQRAIVEAFLAASREGRFEDLIALLHPDVVLRGDAAVVAMGAEAEVTGAEAVAQTFSGRAQVAKPALVGGHVGAVFMPGGAPRVAFDFTVRDGKVVAIDLIADPDHLAALAITPL
jgi:RNA polymerase sigma-70 factor (ECF subfamily)